MHWELPLSWSSSNSYMPECFLTWKNHLTRRIWRTAHMKRLCQILKRSWNWMIGKLQTSFKKNCDATSHQTKSRKTQINWPPLQNATSPSEPVPLTQTKKKDRAKTTKTVPAIINNNNNGGQKNPISRKKISKNTNAKKTNNQKDRKYRPVYPPCGTCGKTNHSTEKRYFEANAANRPPLRNRRPEGQNQVQQRNVLSNSDVNVQAAAQTLH